MKKFNIKPYVHIVQIRNILSNGKLFGPEILKVNDDYMKTRVLAGISNIASFSLAASIPTRASAPHAVMSGLTKLLGLKIHTGIDVPSLKGGAPSADVPSAAPVEAKVADKKGGKDDKKDAKKKAPEPEPEEEEAGGFGELFG